LRGEAGAAGRRRQVADAVDDDELALGVEAAGVARVHPAVAQVGHRRRLVAVVAGEHVGVAGDDLADALAVGVVDLRISTPASRRRRRCRSTSPARCMV
jgi:hypothetical protein